MGLIKAIAGAAGGVLADSWKDYFYCESLPVDVLVEKGHKRAGKRSSNTKGSDNIITTGSALAVADGQCMIIVEQGKVVDLCAEPGEYTYDATTEPSIFSGSLSEGIAATFKNIGKRFTFGGEAPMDQRIYYVNTKELIGNKYGTPNPVPFRVLDERAGIDIDVSVRCFGEYSFRIVDPILFYTNVCSNVTDRYTRDQLDSQMKTELLTALQPAFYKIGSAGIRYSAIVGHTAELADALNEQLSAKWKELRGIEIVSMGVSSITASEEDEKMLKEMQKNAGFKDMGVMAANMAAAKMDAMKDAAKNEGAGAAMAFMGMNMAQGAGGDDLAGLYAQAQAQQAAAAAAQPAAPETAAEAAKPVGWTCPACGTVNQGKFCTECGAKKPAGALQYKCDKCGWTPEDPTKPPKFCPECGDPFGDEDIVAE